mgnify:CR=1 FL=1
MTDERSENLLPEGCRLIPIPCVGDERGRLAFAEGDSTIPFPVRRVFWIYDVPVEARRGGHAHWTCAEVVVAVQGGFTMYLCDGIAEAEVRMERADVGILVPAGVWCELRDFQPHTVLVVMASEPYGAQGYVHSFEEYKKQR